MKNLLALGSLAALLLASSAASAANIAYKATLNGKQETPANASAATGTTTNLVFNTNNNKLTGTVNLTGIAATTAQHIHMADCGTMGGVAVTLDPPANNKI